MRKIIVLTTSFIMVTLGFLIENRGLATMGNSGNIVYPISSGSEDGFVLKVALILFLVSGLCALGSVFSQRLSKHLNWIFWSNQILFFICLALVNLDSNILISAKLGDWIPLLAAILSGVSLLANLLFGSNTKENA